MIHLLQITSILGPTISSEMKNGILELISELILESLFLIVFIYYSISFVTSTNDNVYCDICETPE